MHWALSAPPWALASCSVALYRVPVCQRGPCPPLPLLGPHYIATPVPRVGSSAHYRLTTICGTLRVDFGSYSLKILIRRLRGSPGIVTESWGRRCWGKMVCLWKGTEKEKATAHKPAHRHMAHAGGPCMLHMPRNCMHFCTQDAQGVFQLPVPFRLTFSTRVGPTSTCVRRSASAAGALASRLHALGRL